MSGNIDVHITHECNLRCECCGHYSNYGHRGHVDYAALERWFAFWSEQVEPRQVTLLGGEPALNPDLPAYVGLFAKYWKRSAIRISTNGLLLYRHPTLPEEMAKHENVRLSISIHGTGETYRDALRRQTACVAEWVREHNVAVEFTDSVTYWVRPYLGQGESMMPYQDGNYEESWKHCPVGHDECFQLLDGDIYKCAPLAYLPMQCAKFELDEAWDPYLGYEPLRLGSSPEAIEAFFRRRAEPVCGMCPTQLRLFRKPDPI